MFAAIIVTAFVLFIAAVWFVGLWNNVLNLVNVFLAASLASSLFEPVANYIDLGYPTYTYVVDFLAVWGIFFISFGVMRLVTELLSRYRVTFPPIVEYGGRTIAAVAAAWIFVCFTGFTLHMAPVKPDFFAGGPRDQQMLVGPDRLWMRYLHSRSKGALAASESSPFLPEYDLPDHPDDGELNARVFDPYGQFIYKYRRRRATWSKEDQLRVYRPE